MSLGEGQALHGEDFIAFGFGVAEGEALGEKDAPYFVGDGVGKMEGAEVGPDGCRQAGSSASSRLALSSGGKVSGPPPSGISQE